MEQAKVISGDPGFSSIERTMRSYSACYGDEKNAIELLSSKALRPAAATKDSLSLGSKRPCVGQETSTKIHKVLTSIDPSTKI